MRTYLMKDGIQLQPITINTSGTMLHNEYDSENGRYIIQAGSGGSFSIGYSGERATNKRFYIKAFCFNQGQYGYLNFGNSIAYNYRGNGEVKFNASTNNQYDYGIFNQESVYISGGTNVGFYIYDIYYEDEVENNIILEDNPLSFTVTDDMSLQANFLKKSGSKKYIIIGE